MTLGFPDGATMYLEVSIDYVILGANSTDLPRNETPESIRNSDVFIGVDF